MRAFPRRASWRLAGSAVGPQNMQRVMRARRYGTSSPTGRREGSLSFRRGDVISALADVRGRLGSRLYPCGADSVRAVIAVRGSRTSRELVTSMSDDGAPASMRDMMAPRKKGGE